MACAISAQAEDSEQGESSHSIGSTSFAIFYPEDVAGDPSASFSFDKDIIVNGNGLPAGTYELGLHAAAEDDVHVVFKQRTGEEEGNAEGTLKEQLRLAVRLDEAPVISGLQIQLERIEEQTEKKREKDDDEDDDGGGDRRRAPTEPSATMKIFWGGHVAALRLQMTGVRWVGTPPPDIPDHLQEPWALVLHSLNGLAEENVEMHVRDFSDDFESDWHDGGSKDAQIQFFGWMSGRGGLEGTVLLLDKLDWTEADNSVTFRNMIMMAPVTTSSLEYTVTKTDAGWQITYLYGPPESHI
jgi:hypothetical protein